MRRLCRVVALAMLLAAMPLIHGAPGLAQDATPIANGAGANVTSFTSATARGVSRRVSVRRGGSFSRTVIGPVAGYLACSPLAAEDRSERAV
jgi:hypothetical protein